MPARRSRRRGSIRVGLTGGFGSGKSTVLRIFRSLGAYAIDADEIVHDLLARDGATRRSIARRFGPEVVTGSGTIDRKALAARIFGNRRDRRDLERIIHPAVRRRILKVVSARRRGIVVADIPLLFESGYANRFDAVVVVTANRESRIRRLAARGFSARDFQRRARAQWPLARKARLADHVVDNNGSIGRTRSQVRAIWRTLNSN